MTQIDMGAQACHPNTWKEDAGKFQSVQHFHGNLMNSVWAMVENLVSKTNQKKSETTNWSKGSNIFMFDVTDSSILGIWFWEKSDRL